ncbi:MAG: SCP2 sterol-binding domain-containing protein [Oleibacter sp.]|nr:SCP2 sterol-binding domain-containing protein [Thalassolituus sp.]
MLRSLTQVACLPAELLINRLLREDPVALKHVARIEGRLMAVHIDQQWQFNIRFLRDGITISSTQDIDYDVLMSGRMSDFLALARSKNKANALINSPIDLQGDTELALSVTRIVEKLDIDWEHLITPLTGSLLAHQLGKGVRGVLQWGRSSAPTYRTALKDYLEDEAQVVTPAPLLKQFNDDVDRLRLATDRLTARLDALKVAANTKD